MNAGSLALIGGAEWQHGCDFDARLLAASEGNEVLVLPAAAAYEHPNRTIEAAQSWFGSLGATVRALPVLRRDEAEDPANAQIMREARFIYIADGSPLHLRSVLKDSLLFEALTEAWHSGAVVAGSSAGATVLGDPMVDPRGGAFTLGLGLVRNLAVVPHWDRWTGDMARRMTQLIPPSVVAAEIEERTALIRNPDGSWETAGAGKVTLTLNGETVDPSAIAKAVEL